MESSKLKVIFLVGLDRPSSRRSLEAVCRLPGVEPVGVILKDEGVSLGWRLKRLFRRTRENGWLHPANRMLEAIASATTALVNDAGVSQTEVSSVLRQAFPNRCFSMADVGKKFGMNIHAVGDSDDAEALRVLKGSGADLGIALTSRAVDLSASAIPRLGWVAVQEGIAFEAGEMPPGFWELYEGASSAEVCVRLFKDGSRVGDVIARSAVPLHAAETPDSLLEKLQEEGSRVLASAVGLIRDGKALPLPQQLEESKFRREPAREEVMSLQRRLPHWRRNGAVATIVRNFYVLFVYYSGIYLLVRQWHRMGRSRAAIVLYHRVNDYSKDVLTVDCRTFAAQLLAISQRYFLISSAEMVDRIRSGKPLRPTTVTMQFDDCYRDIFLNGAPIMKVCGVPACAFLNSGFIDTNRTFAHDIESPFDYENLSTSEVQTWVRMGFEVGAHTINHVDLGTCPVEDAGPEIAQCGVELEKITGKPVNLFAFPFGQPRNIREETLQIIQSSGYLANFSVYGGFIDSRTDPFSIPRGGAHYESSPIYCLLQIEGLTLSRLAKKIKRARSRPAGVATQV